VVFVARGQVAVEYLMLAGFLLLFVGAFVGFSLTLYYDSVKASALNDSMVSLRDAADKVYSLGKDNVIVVQINLPDDVIGSGVVENNFYFIRNFNGNPSYSYAAVNPQLLGSLPSSQGIYKIAVKALDSNVSFSVVG